MGKRDRSMLEIILMPLVIALVGLLGTMMVTNQQNKSAEIQMQASIVSTEKTVKSDQKIKILQIFSEKILSENIEDREFAIKLLGVLDNDLADKIASVITQSETIDTTTRKIAEEFKKTLKGNYIVIGSYYKLIDAQHFASELERNNFIYPLKIYKNETGMYAVCIRGSIPENEIISLWKTIKNLDRFNDVYYVKSRLWDEI